MSYQYASRTVWLYSPGHEPDEIVAWGLCDAHADRLRVPVGWSRTDRRTGVLPRGL